MNALPRLWVQINKFAKDLENKAQKRAEARKKRTTTDEFFNDAFGWERKIEEEIEILFRHAKNNDPRQMKFPFGDENQGSSIGNNRNDKGKEPERKPTNNENTEKQSEVAKITERKIGQSGKYEEMIDGAPFHDGNEAHHMPSQKWLKANGMNTKEGFSAIMSQKLHKLTRTNGRSGANIDTSQPYRSEIGRDLNEYVRILKDNKSWTPEVRENLMNGLDGFKKEFPDLFKKVMK